MQLLWHSSSERWWGEIMNQLNLKVRKGADKYSKILIDDKKVKSKKDSFGSRIIKYETENDTVDIKIYSYLEINNKLWLLTNIFFYIISLFGLFDIRLNKTCKVVDCHFVVKMKDLVNMTITTKGKNTQTPQEAEVECDSEYQAKENVIYIDSVAKKRFKILKIAKIITFILIMAIIVGIIALSVN